MSYNMKKDLNCQNTEKQEDSEENDDESVKDFDLDEEIDDYLDQLEAIPIELLEENCGESADLLNCVENDPIETSETTIRNRCEKSVAMPPFVGASAIKTIESINNCIMETVFSSPQQKEEGKEIRLIDNKSINCKFEENFSNEICKQFVSNVIPGIQTREGTLYCRKGSVINLNKSGNLEKSFETNMISLLSQTGMCSMQGKSKSKMSSDGTVLLKRKRRVKQRKHGKRKKNNKKMSNEGTKNVKTGFTETKSPSMPVKDEIKSDVVYFLESSLNSEIESPIIVKKECVDYSYQIESLDIAKKEGCVMKHRRNSSSSSTSSLSGRETVILPLCDPRLPQLKQKSEFPSPDKLKTSDLSRISSTESLFQGISTEKYRLNPRREPSPFPISKAILKVPQNNEITSALKVKNSELLLLRSDSYRLLSDCSQISSETDVCNNGSDSMSKSKQTSGCRQSRNKDSPSFYCTRSRSHSTSPFSTRKPKSRCSYYAREHEFVGSKVDERSHSKSKSPSSPKYEYFKSESLSRRPLDSKISPSSISSDLELGELRTPIASNSPAKEDTDINKSEQVLKSDSTKTAFRSKSSTPIDDTSSKRNIIDYKSLSPLSNSVLESQTRRSRFKKWRNRRSQTRSPHRQRRRSRSLSPWRKRRKYRRSLSRSVSPRRRRSRSFLRRMSRSVARKRYIRPKSPSYWKERKSRSPKRNLRRRRKRSSSMSISPSSSAEKRMKLREETETTFSSLIAALNGVTSSTEAASITKSQGVPSATTNPALPQPPIQPGPYTPKQETPIVQMNAGYSYPSHNDYIVPTSGYPHMRYQHNQPYQSQPYSNLYYQGQDGYQDTSASYVVSTSFRHSYGDYNQMTSYHQQTYYQPPSNFNLPGPCFQNACLLPVPQSCDQTHVDNLSLQPPPPLPPEECPPPPPPLDPDLSPDRDKLEMSCHMLPVLNSGNNTNRKKSTLSPLTYRLQSNLRYLLPEVTKNKPSSDVLKVIDRALQSPHKVTPPSSSTSSSSVSPGNLSPMKIDRSSENVDEEKLSEISHKTSGITMIVQNFTEEEICGRVSEKPKQNVELDVTEKTVYCEQNSQSPSKIKKQDENKDFQSRQNQFELSKLDTDFELSLKVNEKELENSCFSESNTVSPGSNESSLKCMSKFKPLSVLAYPKPNNSFPLNKSGVDYEVVYNRDLQMDCPTNFVSKVIFQSKEKNIHPSANEKHPKYRPIVLNPQLQKNLLKSSLFQNDASSTELLSSETKENKGIEEEDKTKHAIKKSEIPFSHRKIPSADNVKNQLNDDTSQSISVELKTFQVRKANFSTTAISKSSGDLKCPLVYNCTNYNILNKNEIVMDNKNETFVEKISLSGKETVELKDNRHAYDDKVYSAEGYTELFVPESKQKMSVSDVPNIENKNERESNKKPAIITEVGDKGISTIVSSTGSEETVRLSLEAEEKPTLSFTEGNYSCKKGNKETTLLEPESKSIEMDAIVSETTARLDVKSTSVTKQKCASVGVTEIYNKRGVMLMSETHNERKDVQDAEKKEPNLIVKIPISVVENEVEVKNKSYVPNLYAESTAITKIEKIDKEITKVECKELITSDIESKDSSTSFSIHTCNEISSTQAEEFNKSGIMIVNKISPLSEIEHRQSKSIKTYEQTESMICDKTELSIINKTECTSHIIDQPLSTELEELTNKHTNVNNLNSLLSTSSVNIPQSVEIETSFKANDKNLSVKSGIQVMHPTGPISPSGNKENLPIMNVNMSALENPTPSGSNVGNSKLQPLIENLVVLSTLPTEIIIEGEINETCKTDSRRLNFGNELPELSETSLEILKLPVSVDSALNLPHFTTRLTNLEKKLEDVSNVEGNSTLVNITVSVVDEKNSKIVKPEVIFYHSKSEKESTSRAVDGFNVPVKSTKKSSMCKKGTNVKSCAKSRFLEDNNVKYKNRNKAVKSEENIIQSSSWNFKEVDVSTNQDLVVLTANSPEDTEVCKCCPLTVNPDVSPTTKTKRKLFRKKRCRLLFDSVSKLCMKASITLNDPKLKMHPVVKIDRNEMEKELSKRNGTLLGLTPGRRKVSSGDTSETSAKTFSFINMLVSQCSTATINTGDHFIEFDHLNVLSSKQHPRHPQTLSHFFHKNQYFTPEKQSSKNIGELPPQLSKSLKSEYLFCSPSPDILLSNRQQLALSSDNRMKIEKCADVITNEHGEENIPLNSEQAGIAAKRVHQSPLLVKQQHVNNLAKHQLTLWSWSENETELYWEEVSRQLSIRDTANTSVEYNFIDPNEKLEIRNEKLTKPVLMNVDNISKNMCLNCDNNANSIGDKEALVQIMKMLNIPKRTVTTQVDLVEGVLRGSENVTKGSELKICHPNLTSALERIMIRLSDSETVS